MAVGVKYVNNATKELEFLTRPDNPTVSRQSYEDYSKKLLTYRREMAGIRAREMGRREQLLRQYRSRYGR